MSGGSPFTECIVTEDGSLFDRPVEALVEGRMLRQLLDDCEQLDQFWMATDNLYHRVRALVFLYYLHRFVLPERVAAGERDGGESLTKRDLEPVPIPVEPHRALQQRRFREAIEMLRGEGLRGRLNETLSSGLAQAYRSLALQSLADQVRKSVRREPGNQWMFRIGHPDDYPLRVRKELLPEGEGAAPWLIEQTPVRMDLSHSSWSDIFFLGMDRPEFAKVINVSVDLALTGSETGPVPPCLAALRVIDRPVVRLVSIDLDTVAEVEDLGELFDFGRDYLGLLKAALIASGLIPPGMESVGEPLERLLSRLVGAGRGLELVSWVRDIPKGSRLAVSTNLLGSLLACCMRATGQIPRLAGPLEEESRRLVAARAILGEWLGGSGGGWQDSGGVWPGVKLIEGCDASGRIAAPLFPELASEGDPRVDWMETEASGALLPRHTRLDGVVLEETALRRLEEGLVLIHGGMAANVGPILEMVTERYLLRNAVEWEARQESLRYTRAILEALQAGDLRRLGEYTTRHFEGPLKAVIPWASNAFTEDLIAEVRAELGESFLGFWMLGGMSGGGMGLIVEPAEREAAKVRIEQVLEEVKGRYERGLPFAMDPVIYDFKLDFEGSRGMVATGADGENASGVEIDFLREYFRLRLPLLLQRAPGQRSRMEQMDLRRIGGLSERFARPFLGSLLPEVKESGHAGERAETGLEYWLNRYGFDAEQHEQIRRELLAGRLGLRQNRLHPKTRIEDVSPKFLQGRYSEEDCRAAGREALAAGRCAVVSLAAGAGSRWTQGAGVVKALHPFAPMAGAFRNFLEIHVAKSWLRAQESGAAIPHIITTGYLTHEAIAGWLERFRAERAEMTAATPVLLSPGRSVGLRLIPTVRDLQYHWYELPQEKLDEQAEKMRDSVRQALMRWARDNGEGRDYRDNIPQQCLHPVGHWYEVANLLLNGTLHHLLREYPSIDYLLLHNIDTLGADLDPHWLGHHILSGAPLTYEVMQRCFDDVGGGLARVNGSLRLVEGFALPREEDEFRLSYYNTLTTWIDVDALLALFGLDRECVLDPESLEGGRRHEEIRTAVRELAAEMPTYVTLKEAKKRWGRGQEDVFPVLQFERLWGDMSALLAERGQLGAGFVEVERSRGQQLKDPAQLDAWMREGSLGRLEKWLQPGLKKWAKV